MSHCNPSPKRIRHMIEPHDPADPKVKDPDSRVFFDDISEEKPDTGDGFSLLCTPET